MIKLIDKGFPVIVYSFLVVDMKIIVMIPFEFYLSCDIVHVFQVQVLELEVENFTYTDIYGVKNILGKK